MTTVLRRLATSRLTSLVYPAEAEQRTPNAPSATIRIQHLPANCTTGQTIADAETEVRHVLTNASAVIP